MLRIVEQMQEKTTGVIAGSFFCGVADIIAFELVRL